MPPISRLLFLINLFLQISTISYAVASGASGYANRNLLVEADGLAQQLDRPDMRILDIRSRDEYQAGHISTALNWPLAEIAINPGRNDGVTHELPSKEQIERTLGLLGVGNKTHVVLYDDGTSTLATRAFWTLEYYGQSRRVSILNGGFKKWQREGRQMAVDVPKLGPALFRATVDARKLATKEYVWANMHSPGIKIIDARSPKEYAGEDRRSIRGGHVPGAINIDWTKNLISAAGVFNSAGWLEGLYQTAGVTKDKEIVVYCQSGMRASHTYFTLRLLGYPRVRVYDGSWQEWANDAALPVD